MSLPLRIALLLDPFTLEAKGGRHAPELAQELIGLGHVVRAFGAPPGAIPRSGAEAGPEGLRAPGPGGFQPDAVLAYEALSPAAFLGARLARKHGLPLLLVESGFGAAGPRRRRFLRAVGERLWGPYVRRATARLVALDPVARELLAREGFEEGRTELLPGGIDLARFRPGLSSSAISQHRIRGRVLLYVGRIGERRGLEVLIEAFARTVGQRSDWALVLAGDGPGQRRLRALADRLGVGAQLAWLPRPRPEELPGLMGASTLLAVPAVDESVQGSNIPRAMACGLPVIASDLARFRFYVEEDGSGLLAAPGDRVAWIAALGRATGEPEARKRWGRRARALAEARYAWPRIAREFERLILEAQSELARLHAPIADTAQVQGRG